MLRFGEQGLALEVQDGVAVAGQLHDPRPLEQNTVQTEGLHTGGWRGQGKG